MPGGWAPGLRDGDELLGTRPRHEVVAEGERLDSVAGLAGDDKQGAREVGLVRGRADGGGIGAVQHMQAARRERLGEDVGDEARPAHAAHQRAREPVGADRGRQCGVRIPLRERFLGGAHPRELIHWRANIMRII